MNYMWINKMFLQFFFPIASHSSFINFTINGTLIVLFMGIFINLHYFYLNNVLKDLTFDVGTSYKQYLGIFKAIAL